MAIKWTKNSEGDFETRIAGLVVAIVRYAAPVHWVVYRDSYKLFETGTSGMAKRLCNAIDWTEV